MIARERRSHPTTAFRWEYLKYFSKIPFLSNTVTYRLNDGGLSAPPVDNRRGRSKRKIGFSYQPVCKLHSDIFR